MASHVQDTQDTQDTHAFCINYLSRYEEMETRMFSQDPLSGKEIEDDMFFSFFGAYDCSDGPNLKRIDMIQDNKLHDLDSKQNHIFMSVTENVDEKLDDDEDFQTHCFFIYDSAYISFDRKVHDTNEVYADVHVANVDMLQPVTGFVHDYYYDRLCDMSFGYCPFVAPTDYITSLYDLTSFAEKCQRTVNEYEMFQLGLLFLLSPIRALQDEFIGLEIANYLYPGELRGARLKSFLTLATNIRKRLRCVGGSLGRRRL